MCCHLEGPWRAGEVDWQAGTLRNSAKANAKLCPWEGIAPCYKTWWDCLAEEQLCWEGPESLGSEQAEHEPCPQGALAAEVNSILVCVKSSPARRLGKVILWPYLVLVRLSWSWVITLSPQCRRGWSFSGEPSDSSGAGIHALWGGAEKTGLGQPEEEAAS